ncbi:glycosyltransferase [Desulfocurvibacter africanus PCS]|uniref:Glycosyltransferase n=1 Tax=Desulfocurvibacter africanus PCS TaxID=1262666 RepID=M5PNJ7_DESAF|nr:glycosyltransferase [Desulfocurvibacter africanus]EMG35707.1 glycosyltransferase [Desulfocurvibacter africanus PCS]
MRIVYVNSTHKWAGVKTWTLDTAAWLAKHGHEVTIFGRPGPFTDKSSDLGIETFALDFGVDFSPALILRFARFFRTRRTDVLVVNVGKDLRTAGLAARLSGVPVLHRVGLPGDMRDTIKVHLMHSFIKPHILVPSQDTKDGLLACLPHLNPNEIAVIHTGKPVAQEPPEPVRRPLRLIVSSRLSPEKGHTDLLQTLAKLQGQGLDFTLDVLGTGASEDELKALAISLDLHKRVRWLGFQADVISHLRHCDAFVLPSYAEGLPNTLLEAMAQGLCPVARDVGGVREIWPKSGLDGLLAGMKPGDLLAPLERLLRADDEQVRTWKQAAWEQCKAAFNIDTQGRRLEDLLQGFAAMRRQP